MNSTQRQQILNALDAHTVGNTKLSQLTAPLYKHFGITSFAMTILYESGQWLHLTNNTKLYLKRVEKGAASKELTGLSSPYWIRSWPQLGMYLEDHTARTHTILSQLLVKLDFQHPFACLEKIETEKGSALKLCVYRTPKAHREINHFYLNNIEMLKRFNRYVEKELADVISTLPLIIPTPKEKQLHQQHFENVIPSTKQQKAFVKETGLHYPKFTKLAKVQLSQREREVIHWYLLGKSASQTAQILAVSVSAVHCYFERIKRKVGFASKHQLLLKLIDADLLHPDDWEAIY